MRADHGAKDLSITVSKYRSIKATLEGLSEHSTIHRRLGAGQWLTPGALNLYRTCSMIQADNVCHLLLAEVNNIVCFTNSLTDTSDHDQWERGL